MGICAPVTHDVSGHRALKKQQNDDIGLSLESLKHALQTSFSPIKKLWSFTNVMTNVENYKNQKFSLKWPEHLHTLIISINYNK